MPPAKPPWAGTCLYHCVQFCILNYGQYSASAKPSKSDAKGCHPITLLWSIIIVALSSCSIALIKHMLLLLLQDEITMT